MCTLEYSPPLALVWPWQEPWYWAGFAVCLLILVAYAMFGADALRRSMSTLKRRVGWVLLVVSCLSFGIGNFLLLLVALPGDDLVVNWSQQVAQGCSSLLWQLPWTQQQIPLAAIEYASVAATWLGIAVFFVLSQLYPLHEKASRHRGEEHARSGVSN